MKDVDDLFKATASSLWEAMNSHGGNAGFRIPEYQRTYDWNEEKIARLLEDAANGLYFLTDPSQEEGSFTFVGTIILVEERHKEPSYDGTSLAVVDGQQRLTTLALVICALIEAISSESKVLELMSGSEKRWLDEEVEFELGQLYKCIVGQFQEARGRNSPFPRIVRQIDTRAGKKQGPEYRSLIAHFLYKFAKYYENEESSFSLPKFGMDSGDEQRFKRNYERILSYIRFLSAPDLGQNGDGLDCQVVAPIDFKRKGIKGLFAKLEILESVSEQDRVLSKVSKGTQADRIIRLLLFAAYLMHCVVLTRVETRDESRAFDIFDALNTTGEPLTAIETFKPQVMRYEQRHSRGFISKNAFIQIEEDLNRHFPNPNDRQKETKELIVSYALYANGHKLPRDLSSQRKFLRSCYEDIQSSDRSDEAQRFVQGLADMATFRHHYWRKRSEMVSLTNHHPREVLSDIQLCFSLVREMHTSLFLPASARFWSIFKSDQQHESFTEAIRALTAFVVLRRAATGTTSGIDSDLRNLMDPNIENTLCVGLIEKNISPSLDLTKRKLRDYLTKRSVEIDDKASWIKRVCGNPLARQSKPLTRFLLLAAADASLPDESNPGFWQREDAVPAEERHFLTFDRWSSDQYLTIEHVAPQTEPKQGWDKSIYQDSYTRDTLGNLVLLPSAENSAAGNAGWERKKLFYLALSEEKRSERRKRAEEAKALGFQFTTKFQKILDRKNELTMLNSLRRVEGWNKEFIENRTRNIAGLAWDRIAPWLFD
ncbi:MAG: DUF262 domain-containing HNH endonuclease family protein [Candidatus Dadabacteria bacterium]|nr:DUF262 domain-containing HNH endonuclease family protein [Candidatus Dadabacteria bacterium]